MTQLADIAQYWSTRRVYIGSFAMALLGDQRCFTPGEVMLVIAGDLPVFDAYPEHRRSEFAARLRAADEWERDIRPTYPGAP